MAGEDGDRLNCVSHTERRRKRERNIYVRNASVAASQVSGEGIFMSGIIECRSRRLRRGGAYTE